MTNQEQLKMLMDIIIKTLKPYFDRVNALEKRLEQLQKEVK